MPCERTGSGGQHPSIELAALRGTAPATSATVPATSATVPAATDVAHPVLTPAPARSDRLKILIATDCYVHNMGGVTASVLALCAGLRRQGHEVRVLSLANANRSCRSGEDYFIRSRPAFVYPDIRVSFAMRDPLLRELEAWRPDVIHAHSEGSALVMALRLMKRCGAPLVMTCHTDYGYFVFGRLRHAWPFRQIAKLAGSILYRRATAVTVPSEKAARFPFLDGARGRISVVPNGMELEKYRRPMPAAERRAVRARLGIEDDAGTLVAVTRLSREKNVQELIACMPALLERRPKAKLLIVGDGPYRERLENLARRLGVSRSVIFTGRVPAEDVWRLYAAGDVFVSASTFEVHSMSYLEAQARGLPLLCREDEALRGVLAHGENGLAYRCREEFVDFADRLLGDDALRRRLGERSAATAEGFSADAFASSMSEVYRAAIRTIMAITD